MKEDRSIRRSDIILILVLLLAGLALTLALRGGRQQGRQVIVRVEGTQTAAFPLDTDRSFLIEGAGGTNLLVIEDGSAYLSEATCPDKLCVRQGKIRYAGDSLICLPNSVVVEISGEDELNLDAVTG